MEVQVQQPLRRPLQPKNIQWETEPKPKAKQIEIEADTGKENRPFKVNVPPLEASLAEELRAARRRRERLRLEREKAERLQKERERVLERRLRKMEMRWDDQKKMELEIQRIFWIMDLRSCVRDISIQSLRAKEEEKRNAQLKEANCAESSNGSGDPGQLSPQEKGAEN